MTGNTFAEKLHAAQANVNAATDHLDLALERAKQQGADNNLIEILSSNLARLEAIALDCCYVQTRLAANS